MRRTYKALGRLDSNIKIGYNQLKKSSATALNQIWKREDLNGSADKKLLDVYNSTVLLGMLLTNKSRYKTYAQLNEEWDFLKMKQCLACHQISFPTLLKNWGIVPPSDNSDDTMSNLFGIENMDIEDRFGIELNQGLPS
jgi:hypothetical protein